MLNITELTCRVCLEEQNVLINIYDELEELHTNLSNLLETCADLQINEDDIFPKYLCEDCTRELLITSKFRDKCVKSQEILKELMENAKVIEIEKTTNSPNDLIEYNDEDLKDVDIDDLIVENSSFEQENEDHDLEEDKVVPEEQEVAISLLRKNCSDMDSEIIAENIMETQISTQEQQVMDNNNEQVQLFSEEAKEEEVNSIIIPWDNESSLIQDTEIDTSTSKPARKYHIFKCDICGAIFKQAINLQKHLQKSHDPMQYFTCNKCDHWFSLENEFYKHVESCSYIEITTELNLDVKKAKNEKILPTTLEQDHNRKCIYCERDFATPFALRMHLRTHTGERPFHCKYCTKSFKTQSQLNVHHKRHTGQADFICSICNKAFYEQSNLTVHMRSHTGERPHVCTICNKTFTRVFLLQFHMRTHTGEKPYKCNYCDKNFRQHTDLRSHLTIHMGQKQHSCILCGKSYIKRSHLVQHMRKHELPIQSEETGESLQYDNSTEEELNTATENIQSYVQNPEILYNFDEIIESEDVIAQNEEFS